MEFANLTPEQQAALAVALATLHAAELGLGDPARPPDTPPQGPLGA